MEPPKRSSALYDGKFFSELNRSSLASARALVPLLTKNLAVKSVLDVGCGHGAWLSVFRDHGVTDVVGLDGNYVSQEHLMIPQELFTPTDLEKVFQLERTFDLVLCLEVAEHLSKEAGDRLIQALTKHGSHVLFSASIPYQDGTGHINEQWPAYWAEKFRELGYAAFDLIRPLIWTNPEMSWWFAQNTVLYVQKGAIDERCDPKTWTVSSTATILPLVHPDLLNHKQTLLEHERSKSASYRGLLGAMFQLTRKRFFK